MPKQKNKQRGVTLIVLVVSIIVLIILAGVSIAMLVGENGIITQAQRAQEETEQAKVEELKELAMLEASVHLEGYEYTDSNGEKVNIPAQCAVSKIEGEDTLENGLVIIDVNGNEWVWIEVPHSIYENVMYNDNNSKKPINSEDYGNIEYVMQQYTSTYRDDTNQGVGTGTDEWYDGNGLTAEQGGNIEDSSGCGLTSNEYTELKQKMLKSVYENEGFYIGRYEVGIKEDIIRNYNNSQSSEEYPINNIPVIQQNKYVYNWVRCNQAQELAEKLSIGEKTSSLMFGIQWDLVLKYIENKNPIFGDSNKTVQQRLKEDATSWGNYSNAGFYIMNVKAQYSMDDGMNYKKILTEGYSKPTESVLLTTGATKRNSVLGIYDLAGNVYERTLERTSDVDNPCSLVGGCYFSDGTNVSASYRGYGKIYYSYNYTGFRTVLY